MSKMYSCRVPNQYYHGYSDDDNTIILADEVSNFIQKYNLTVLREYEYYSVIKLVDAIEKYGRCVETAFPRSTTVIKVESSDKDIITLFKMTF